MEETRKVGYRDILKQKEYMKSTSALVVNRFGDAVDAIASTWIVYELTGNAMWSALIYGMNTLPTVLITPFAGAFVEGRNKKAIMVLTDLIRALCVAYIATGYLLGILQAWHLVITTLIISTVEAFRTPASTAITPMILEKEYYDYGMSLSGALSTVVELIGTGLAAGIIAAIGTSGAIYLDMATFVVSAGIIATMNTREEKKAHQKFDGKEYFETLKEGLSYSFQKKAILLLCMIALFLNGILVPINSLQAPFIKEVLGGGAAALSVLGVSSSLSMLAGSVLYPMIRKKVSAMALCVFCGGAISLFYIGTVVCRPLYVSELAVYVILAAFTFLLCLSAALVSAFASVEILKVVEEGYFARVGAIFAALTVAVNPIVSFLLTAVTKVIGTATIFLIAGGLAVVATILMFLNKSLKEM